MKLVPFSKLLLNLSKLEKNFQQEKVAHFHKLSNTISFASIGLAVYKWHRKYELGCSVCKILWFSKLLFIHNELEKNFNMGKERVCSSFPTPYYLPHSDKWFRNAIENTIHVFCVKKKRFSKLLLNRLHFANNSTWVMILVSIAFQWYIVSPIWVIFAEFQPSTGGSSTYYCLGRSSWAQNNILITTWTSRITRLTFPEY